MDDQIVPLGTHTFSESDQEHFAELSGDRNPMHVDALIARRTQAGRRVVHGVHLLLWALETSLARDPGSEPVSRIQAKFARLVGVGDTAALSMLQREASSRTLYVKIGDAVACLVVVTFGPRKSARQQEHPSAGPVEADAPIERDFAEASQVSGSLRVRGTGAAEGRFPTLTRVLGPVRTEAMLQLTRWVGMINPGLHSIFTGIDVFCVAEESDTLSFQVSAAVERFRHLRQSVEGGGLSGSVESVVRIPAVRQASFQEIRGAVNAGEFAGMNALVIGVSRGLGEVTAKVIAAGGGTVVGTYAMGENDAAAVAAEIVEGGGRCTNLQLRVGENTSFPSALPGGINALFYFATPPVQPDSSPGFDPVLFGTYLQTYVEGFSKTCTWVLANSDSQVCAFYPSTVYVESRPKGLKEYAMAKAAGEILSAELARNLPRLQTLSRRIPRVMTDLSASVFEEDASRPLPVVLEFVRAVAAALKIGGSRQDA